MKPLLVKTYLFLIIGLLLAGCAPQAQQPTSAVPLTGGNNAASGTVVATPNVQDANQLIRAAQTYGLDAHLIGPIQQPFFNTDGNIIRVGGENLQVFVFPSEAEQKQALDLVPGNGKAIAGTEVVWVATMKFWSGGKVIVLYPGDNEKVIGFLNAIFGPARP